jgi:hypothetical protein
VLFGDIQSFLADLLRGRVARRPPAIVVGTRLSVVVVAVGGIGAAGHRSWRLLATVMAPVVGGTGRAATNVIDTTSPLLVDPSLEIGLISSDGFPTLAGVVLRPPCHCRAPWLPRRWRCVGWVLVFALSVSLPHRPVCSVGIAFSPPAGWPAPSCFVAGWPELAPTAKPADALVGPACLRELAPASVGPAHHFGRAADGRRVFAKPWPRTAQRGPPLPLPAHLHERLLSF